MIIFSTRVKRYLETFKVVWLYNESLIYSPVIAFIRVVRHVNLLDLVVLSLLLLLLLPQPGDSLWQVIR